MTARDIQRRLVFDLYRRSFAIPNYTPRGWFECDVFEVTAAGYWREYEVKVSRSDFFADAKKLAKEFRYTMSGDVVKMPQTKHQLMNDTSHGPKLFYFVMPEGLVLPHEIPDWAGLMYAKPGGKLPVLYTARRAPERHGRPVDAAVLTHARGVCYYRFLNGYLRGKFAPQDELLT